MPARKAARELAAHLGADPVAREEAVQVEVAEDLTRHLQDSDTV